MITLTLYTDPGHGWLAADLALIRDLGIGDQISRYSYRDTTRAYLEEDRDAGILIAALDKRFIEYRITEKHTDRESLIRDLDRW